MNTLTVYSPPEGAGVRAAIMYLHGGGLIYGSRDDLPEEYIKLLTGAGYSIYAYDYPLAPEADLSMIHDYVFRQWEDFMTRLKEEGTEKYFLFGRSAGAYLALILAKRITAKQPDRLPLGILDFYGYFDLSDDFVSVPSPYYSKFPQVPEAICSKHRFSGELVLTGPLEQRYAIYVYARQKGAWGRLLGGDRLNDPSFSLNEEDIRRLPPLFITASTDDNDVPYRVSRRLSRLAPEAKFVPVYYLEHDFDRNTQRPEGKNVYMECVEWMNGVCSYTVSK